MAAEWSEPVVAWALCESGNVLPVEAEGTVALPIEVGTRGYELWHPDGSSQYCQDHLGQYHEQLEAGGS